MFKLTSNKINYKQFDYKTTYLFEMVSEGWELESYVNIGCMFAPAYTKDIKFTCFLWDGYNKILKHENREEPFESYFINLIKDPNNIITKNKVACFSFLKD